MLNGQGKFAGGFGLLEGLELLGREQGLRASRTRPSATASFEIRRMKHIVAGSLLISRVDLLGGEERKGRGEMRR